jgi:hypothetical protein
MEYPIVKIPARIINASKEDIPFSDNLVAPKIPLKREIDFSKMFPYITGVIIISAITDADTQFKIYFAGGVSLFIFLFYLLIESNNIITDFKIENEKFNSEIQIYEIKNEQLKILRDKIRNEQDTIAYRKKRIYEELKKSQEPDLLFQSKKGKSEIQFNDFLQNHFPGKIFLNCAVAPYSKSKPYQPDFTYQDPETGLHIDIEVDEPYSFETLEPIHFLEGNEHIDDSRDFDILFNNWFIIRFAEEQIVKSPGLCCDYIENVVRCIYSGDIELISQLEFYLRIPAWNKVDAISMANSEYRNTYLTFSDQPLKINIRNTPNNVKLKAQKNVTEQDEDDLPF